ncbi:MAG: hypothetical protein KC464_29120, partial [Myxococcales bacterium]|nr:hypothetical protein [Myxococcales bacterium]
MRIGGLILLIGVMAVVAGCGGDDGGAPCSYGGRTYPVGAVFPAGDGCNSCSCTASGVACTELACAFDGGVDADPASCAAAGGCPAGPTCDG